MRNIIRLLKLGRPYRVQIAIALVLLVAVVGVDLILPRLIQRIIDEGVVPGDMGTIVRTSLLMLGFAMLNALMMIGNTILAARVAQYFAADLRSVLFRKVQSFSYGNLDQTQTGQLIVRLTSDVNTVQMLLLMSLTRAAGLPAMPAPPERMPPPPGNPTPAEEPWNWSPSAPATASNFFTSSTENE